MWRGRLRRLIMYSQRVTHWVRGVGPRRRRARGHFAERKTYCNLEVFRGSRKRWRVRCSLESLWENFTRERPAAGEEVSFFLFFLYFVREGTACENSKFSRGVLGHPESALFLLKALHYRRARDGAGKRCLRVVFLQV